MDFLIGIGAGVAVMAGVIEWRTGIFRDLWKLRDWNPFNKHQRGTQKKKEDD